MQLVLLASRNVSLESLWVCSLRVRCGPGSQRVPVFLQRALGMVDMTGVLVLATGRGERCGVSTAACSFVLRVLGSGWKDKEHVQCHQ